MLNVIFLLLLVALPNLVDFADDIQLFQKCALFLKNHKMFLDSIKLLILVNDYDEVKLISHQKTEL